MSRQVQSICPCSGWSRDVGSSIRQPPLMLPQWHGFLIRVCSLSLRLGYGPVPQGSGLQLCMAGASNSLRYCNTWGTATPAYRLDNYIVIHTLYWYQQGIEDVYIELLKEIYTNSSMTVHLHTQSYKINIGIYHIAQAVHGSTAKHVPTTFLGNQRLENRRRIP